MKYIPKQEAQPHKIRVPTSRKVLKIQPFCISQNQQEIGRAWKEWLKDFKEETEYCEIKRIRNKVSVLKITKGQKSRNWQEIHQNHHCQQRMTTTLR